MVVILQFKFHVSLSLQLPWPCILCQQAGGHGAIFPILLLRCHPLRTMRPSPPTTVTELQQGESHLGAFGTGTRRHWVILQSQCGWSCCPLWETVLTILQAVNPDLTPDCQVGEEECAGRVGVASLLFVEFWLWSGALYVDVKVSAVAPLPCIINAS